MANILRAFGEILRRDDEKREVTGYAYVQADAGDGWVLPRSVMERANDAWAGNIRAMHQPIAAGLTVERSWDTTGLLVTAKIVDDKEWEKVVEGVYRGFSVGFAPSKFTRADGKRVVTDGKLVELSLVDVPQDSAALFTAVSRAEDAEEITEPIDETPDETPAVEPEAESVPEPEAAPVVETPAEDATEPEVERGSFADAMAKRESDILLNAAFDQLRWTLWEIQEGDDGDKAQKVRQAFKEAGDYIAPLCVRGFIADPSNIARAAAEVKPIEVLEPEVKRVEDLTPDPEQEKPVMFRVDGVDEGDKDKTEDAPSIMREILDRDWSTASNEEKEIALLRLSLAKSDRGQN